MKLKTITSFDLKGKTVLLRSDLNSDVSKGRVIPSERIKEAAGTIKALKKLGAKVIIIAHQGNKGKDFLSLKQHAKFLRKYVKVSFFSDMTGPKAKKSIKALRSREAILLENIRFEKAEFEKFTKENKLIKFFMPLVDYYCNDAFSVSHRDTISITGFPKCIPSFAGPLVIKELHALEKVNLKNCLYILGGGKPESNIKLAKKGRNIIATGYFAQMILISEGKNLGYQNEHLKKDALVKGDYETFLKTLRQKTKDVKTPIDFALNVGGQRKEKRLEDFPQKYQIDDIGKLSMDKFAKEIRKAKTIYMKGPAGYSTNPKFAKGTEFLLKEIAKSNAFSIVGGGHLSDAIKNSKISKKKFGHVSLSGGALLNYLAGEKLPGLKALEYYS